MATPQKIKDHLLPKIHELRAEGLSFRKIAERLGFNYTTTYDSYTRWRKANDVDDPFEYPDQSPSRTRLERADGVIVQGLMPDYKELSEAEAWDQAFKVQERKERRKALRKSQRITIPDVGHPFVLAVNSDQHMDDEHCDFKRLKADAEIIRDTERMWLMTHGDYLNAYVVGKLAKLNLNKPPIDFGWRLFTSWLDIVRDKLLVWVNGNHDNWIQREVGLDMFKETLSLRHVPCMFDRDEVVFDLVYQKDSDPFRVCVRHQFNWKSILNPIHGALRHAERVAPADLLISGHLHNATLYAYVPMRGQMIHVLQTGTYKIDDGYGRTLGLPETCGWGSAGMLFRPGKIPRFYPDLEEARDDLQRALAGRSPKKS